MLPLPGAARGAGTARSTIIDVVYTMCIRCVYDV